jgi:hypothetical protein
VDVGAAVVADEESLELVEPGEGAFDNPAVASEAGAVAGVASGDLGFDAALPEEAAVFVVVVAAVSAHPVGAAAGTAHLATNRRDAVDERDQLGDVVAVPARDRPGERDTGAIDQKVVFRPVSGSINRARARRGAPFFACTWLASATARSHSIRLLARNSLNNTSCNRSHTPARCHSSSRR